MKFDEHDLADWDAHAETLGIRTRTAYVERACKTFLEGGHETSSRPVQASAPSAPTIVRGRVAHRQPCSCAVCKPRKA